MASLRSSLSEFDDDGDGDGDDDDDDADDADDADDVDDAGFDSGVDDRTDWTWPHCDWCCRRASRVGKTLPLCKHTVVAAGPAREVVVVVLSLLVVVVVVVALLLVEMLLLVVLVALLVVVVVVLLLGLLMFGFFFSFLLLSVLPTVFAASFAFLRCVFDCKWLVCAFSLLNTFPHGWHLSRAVYPHGGHTSEDVSFAVDLAVRADSLLSNTCLVRPSNPAQRRFTL